MTYSDSVIGHRPDVRVDVQTPVVRLDDERHGVVELEVTNLDRVIRSYKVHPLGMDASWVSIDPVILDLFPDERTTVRISVTLPASHPAGSRTVGFRVGDAAAPDFATQVLVEAVLELEPEPALDLRVEPATIEIRRSGSFLLHLDNTGNTPLQPKLLAQDPERLVDVTFEPRSPVVQPGNQAVVRATASGPRPWLGLPVVRVLTVTATEGDVEPIAAIALVQNPRISRRIIAFLGLLMVVALFALVIAFSFARVADLNQRNEELLAQSLGVDEPAEGRTAPVEVGGAITSSTGGPVRGATVELYLPSNALQPALSTVTDDDTGTYTFTAVPEGSYLLRTKVAGYGQAWYPGVQDVADAETIEVVAEESLDGLDIQLTGQPGLLSGQVLGEDVEGAIVTVELPAGVVTESELEPLASVVQTAELDSTGQFVFGNLPTPATYDLRVQKPGFAIERRTITLTAGQERSDLEILLGRGIGVIRGVVLDAAGDPLPGVDILATDGSSESRTRSLSTDATAGTFELRDLAVPGTYTLTLTRTGYFPETTTVTLDTDGNGQVTVVMTADTGSMSGVVRSEDGQPLGDIVVTVTGADVERSTRSLSVGNVGAWFVDELPVPGTYTVTFSGPSITTSARSLELVVGPGATRTDVDVTVRAALAAVRGRVTNTEGDPIGGVSVTVESTALRRATTSSDDPPGAYVFDNLPAGVYTLVFARAGSAVQTRLVDLGPGADITLEDVQLEAQAAINGVVTRNDIGVANVGVVVYRSSQYPDAATARTTTDANGVFEVPGLDAPETYIVEFEVPAGGEVVRSEVVQLQPGESEFLNVKL